MWSVIATALSDKLYEAFLSGAFATPQSAAEYMHDNWWMLGVTGVMSVITGGAVRANQKAMYINAVEKGSAPPPSSPIVAAPGATVVAPTPPPPTVITPRRGREHLCPSAACGGKTSVQSLSA